MSHLFLGLALGPCINPFSHPATLPRRLIPDEVPSYSVLHFFPKMRTLQHWDPNFSPARRYRGPLALQSFNSSEQRAGWGRWASGWMFCDRGLKRGSITGSLIWQQAAPRGVKEPQEQSPGAAGGHRSHLAETDGRSPRWERTWKEVSLQPPPKHAHTCWPCTEKADNQAPHGKRYRLHLWYKGDVPQSRTLSRWLL